MIFLNPIVLTGLILTVIPLLVHLFNFRRPQRLDYSSIALLQSLQSTTIQRVRIRNWILLLLRILALAAIILIFARPTLVGSSSTQFLGRSNASIVIAMDVSLSMLQRDTDGTRFSKSKTIAQAMIASADPGDEIFIKTTHSPNLEPVRILDDLEPTYASSSASALMLHAANLLSQQGQHLSKIVYYLGDLQETTLVDSVQASVPDEVRIVLVPIGSASTMANVGIVSAEVTSRIVDLRNPVEIEATVVNVGDTPIENYAVSLYLNDTPLAQTSITLPSQVPVSVSLRGTPPSRGWTQGFIMIEDDEFMEDNRHYFTLNIPDQHNILMIYGSTASTLHIELALSSGGESGTLKSRMIPQYQLSAASLNDYSAVFLIGPDLLSSGEVLKLNQFVQNGGGLLLTPSEDVSSINPLLSAFDAGQVDLQESQVSIRSADFEHPLFEGVFEDSDRTQRLESIVIHRSAHYDPGSKAEQTLISLIGGAPLLQEIPYDRGRIFFLSIAPELSWSDLPVRGLFVPLIYRTAHYLSAVGSIQGEHLLVGQQESIRIPGIQGTVMLQLPDGTERIPPTRQVFGAHLVDVKSDLPGIAKILSDRDFIRFVSIGLDPKESRLSFLEPQQAQEILSETMDTSVDLLEPDSVQDMAGAMQVARMGVELWRHFLVLALLLLTAEMFLASHWKNTSQDG